MSRVELPSARCVSPSGLTVEMNANGSLRRADFGATILNLFLGNEIEGGPANLYLRRQGTQDFVALLGPTSPTRFRIEASSFGGVGQWSGLDYALELRLGVDLPAWFWHVRLRNAGRTPQCIELLHVQDIALAPYATVRMNEYYVSQYVDHTPLSHPQHGIVVASRQNLSVNGQHPWSIMGSLRTVKTFATDALQWHGLATRAGREPIGLRQPLAGTRLQHEHSMVVLQDEAIAIAPGASVDAGFFGYVKSHHETATTATDLVFVDRVMALTEARAHAAINAEGTVRPGRSWFTSAPRLATVELNRSDCDALFGAELRHEEFDRHGKLLSFFAGADSHVVLREKELSVQRPHGHLLRTGSVATPDEQALTSTVWMNGVFNSMLTQGHVSFNRFLSTVRSYLGLYRSQGQRVFAELDGRWQLLDVPSAFEIEPAACRWLYRHADGLVEVRSEAHENPHSIRLTLTVLVGEPLRFMIVNHVALDGDDGATRQAARIERRGEAVFVAPNANSELGQRFPRGGFLLTPQAGTHFEHVGGDELLFDDARSPRETYVCITLARSASAAIRLSAQLIDESVDLPAKALVAARASIERLLLAPPLSGPLVGAVERLADIIPWFTHNAFIHFLSPRGLEQYTGGGWGTRDVTQGPVELLLSVGHTAPVRDLLLRVMRAQRPDGDWPQWFMFFERDRNIRAGDSHGDIVFWPVLAVAQYLIASGDASLLDEDVPFFDGERATLWQHIERALALIERRVIQGTALAAYGHGDWNDSLQPADPAMREHMCSAWTVTLHHQMLTTLARALRMIGRDSHAPRFEQWASAVRSDFQRQLIVDRVLAGYVLLEGGQTRYLLHPRDAVSGVRFSSLAMIHALLEDMFTPEQAREHMRVIDEHLLGPDGVRLFDRPLPYHGGPMRLFQRAESAAFFGREIGLMYMHAHLRYAQALARLGHAERFFTALCQANPIGIRSVISQATLRQANCYYSSSDAAFADRYQAGAEYERVNAGAIPLDGGWRVYSSGAGIALGLIVRRFLGLNLEFDALLIDPVMPASLNGMHIEMELWGQPLDVTYEVKGKGCGVTAITMNGNAVQFTREANPYRLGAARVPSGELRHLLSSRQNSLRVALG